MRVKSRHRHRRRGTHGFSQWRVLVAAKKKQFYATVTSSGLPHLPSSCHQGVERGILASVRLSGWTLPPLITITPVQYLHKRQSEVLLIATVHEHKLPLVRDTITHCGEIAEKEWRFPHGQALSSGS